MHIKCSCCGKPIKTKAALLFSPPKNQHTKLWMGDEVVKYHVCNDCFEDIKVEFIDNNRHD